jgi:hypothetical protein
MILSQVSLLQIILEVWTRLRMTLLDSEDCSESNLHIAPVIVATRITSQVIVTWNVVLKAPLYYCEETVMILVLMLLHI